MVLNALFDQVQMERSVLVQSLSGFAPGFGAKQRTAGMRENFPNRPAYARPVVCRETGKTGSMRYPLVARSLFLFFTVSAGCLSCSTKGIFSSKTAHEKYAAGIEEAGLRQTQLGVRWFLAANRSLQSPLTVNLPYKETGYFPADNPDAAGYVMELKRGELVDMQIQTVPVRALVFAELWQPREGRDPEFLAAFDTATHTLKYEIKSDGNYLVRIQPELLQGVQYTVTITTAASLAFPIKKSDSPRMISFWGADRDGGTRSHEGIDIAAKRLTPAVAVAEGQVTRAGENNLGGKIIFLRPNGKSISVYYAHLDSQFAKSGDRVRAGDTIGLVGNTGNARSTIPHLHFGIYAAGGAIDPFPFINADRPAPKNVTASTENINQFMRTKTAIDLYSSVETGTPGLFKLEKGAVLQVLAATQNWYKVRLPDGQEGYANSGSLTTQFLLREPVKESTSLLDAPDQSAAVKRMIPSPNELIVLGRYQEFQLVRFDGETGWIRLNRPD